MDILTAALELVTTLRAARQMPPDSTLWVDTPDFSVTIKNHKFNVTGFNLHRAANPTPGVHVETNALTIIFDILAEVKLAGAELAQLSVGDTQDVDIPDVAIGYKGVRYDVVSLTVERKQ